ncbi:MAG: TetR/AcrR family transcriptional regulator [Deltaproteobacteria bacterium]|nr:TetR/AcrR family transcriptional regulator [Deltaproteobacteria bacterium]
MSEQKLNTEIRKKQIAQAALNLITTQGLKNLSIAGVARRVGLVPSAIYRHFKTKDDLINSVLSHIQDMLLDNVKEVCRETSNSIDRLRRLLFRHIRLIRENLGIPRIVFSEDVYAGPFERRKMVHGIITGYLDGVADIVRQGQKSGQILPDIDAATVSLIFLGLVQPAGLLWHMSNGSFDVTKYAEKAWKIFARAIRKDNF